MKRNLVMIWVWGLALGWPLPAAAAPAAQAGDEPNLLTTLLPLIVVAVVLALSIGRRLFAGSGAGTSLPPSAEGQPRRYGVAGGAVCRRCGLPFARSLMDPNLLVGKLTRCPHCGKWAVLPAASPAELSLAETRERQERDGAATPAAPGPAASAEEQLRRRIEDSKYE